MRGRGLNAVTSVTLVPSAGMTLGAPVVNADGTELTLPVEAAADAVTGLREVRLSTASGTIPFTRESASRFYIAVGVPRIDSIEPILATQGATFTLLIRGANFQAARAVTATPPEGIVFGSTISVNAAGTELTVPMHVPADSPLGSRAIRVTTPGGTTTDEAVPANTFTVFPP